MAMAVALNPLSVTPGPGVDHASVWIEPRAVLSKMLFSSLETYISPAIAPFESTSLP